MTTALEGSVAGASTSALVPGKRLAPLDGLRAISIGLVLVGHASGTRGFLNLSAERFIGDYANLGVIMFFVISGYLITGLLRDEYQRFGNISLKLFYARRFLRLMPAFFVFIATIFALERSGVISLDRGDLLSAMTYTINFRSHTSWYVGHLWSLSVEEQFYMLWPLTLALSGLTRSGWVAVATMALSPMVRLWAAEYHIPGAIFPCVADSLACGCLLALWESRLTSQTWYTRLIASPFLVPVSVVLILFCSWMRHYLIGIVFGVCGINVLMALILHRTILLPTRARELLSSRWLVTVGLLSYSLYLWQQLFLNRHSDWDISRFPLNLILVLLTASASYYIVEKPLNRLRSRLRRTEPSELP
jgi:peptidoglycan/LPS O-acetylase OafA/YrhL